MIYKDILEIIGDDIMSLEQILDKMGASKPFNKSGGTSKKIKAHLYSMVSRGILAKWHDEYYVNGSYEPAASRVQTVLDMNKSGESLVDIMKATGYSRDSVYYHLRANGLKPNTRKYEDRNQKIQEDLQSGVPVSEICKKYKLTNQRISQLFKVKEVRPPKYPELQDQLNREVEHIGISVKLESPEVSRKGKIDNLKALKENNIKRVVADLSERGLKQGEIAKRLGFCTATIRKYQQQLGFALTEAQLSERNNKIKALYTTGNYTYAQIAEKFNITREQVGNIITGYKPPAISEERKKAKWEYIADYQRKHAIPVILIKNPKRRPQ